MAASAGCNITPHAPSPVSVESYGGYQESLFAVWQDTAPQNAKAYYKNKSAAESGWVQVDAPLIRNCGEGLARFDALGLSAGDYQIKIAASDGAQSVIDNVKVTAYDRSGYAHFQRRPEEAAYGGVGAYKDDGTIKDNTAIIYLTEENKNDIRNSVYLNGEKIDIERFLPLDGNGETLGSIGHLVNGRYADSSSSPIYYLINGDMKIADAINIRVIGKVDAEDPDDGTKSLIDGLTPHGSKDNGRMLQFINCSNVTIEGVGEDAEIYGWGFSLFAKDKKFDQNAGTSFEVRNLTFKNYAEDAIGMEGNKKSQYGEAVLACPVERCWIHNNTFYKGYCADPAEPDKADGDGSVDFKRGQYYTLSYNRFEETNKTCLVGSSGETLQYNVTMHHNWWNKCKTRKPLLRHANLHYYNNYILEDATNTSYVTSLRSNCFMFAEANYYEGCNNVAKAETGSSDTTVGHAKAYQNVYLYCRNADNSVKADSRTQEVTNNCTYTVGEETITDYTHFDTDADLFYYNPDTQQSDCLLEDAVSARQTVMMHSGARGSGENDTKINQYTPSASVRLLDEGVTEITLPTKVESGTEINGVLFNDYAISGNKFRIRGQSITFTLAEDAYINVDTDSSGRDAPELVRSDGTVLRHHFEGNLHLLLSAGTYFISNGTIGVTTNILSLSFEKA